MGGGDPCSRAHLQVRTCRCAPFPYLGNDWTDCVETRFVVRDRLAWRFTKVNGGGEGGACALPGAHVHSLFPYLGNGWIVALKPGVCLGNHQLCVSQRREDIRTSARVTAGTGLHDISGGSLGWLVDP